MNDNSTAILVLGMHRSGTSAATRLLNLLGAHLGEDLLAPQQDNKRGFWEHAQAVAIHERLLGSLGRSWHDTRDLPAGWLASPAGRRAVAEITALVQGEMSGRRLWAVKDPRMCRLAPAWIEALDNLGIRATALLMVREPYEVATSLRVRNGWSYPHAYLMWAEYLLDAFRATAGIPRALLSYEQLLGDWRGHMARVARELDVVWDPGIEQAGPEADAFLSPEERHHHASRAASLARDDLPPAFLDRLYQAGSNADWQRLAELEQRFAAVSAVFSGPLSQVTGEFEAASGERQKQSDLALERLELVHNLQAEVASVARDRAVQEALALERIDRIHQLESEVKTVFKERVAFEALALERIDRIHQLESEVKTLSGERAAFEALALERIDRIHQLESETKAVAEERRACEVLAAERLARIRQMEGLLHLAGSRWWALKRVLRPIRSKGEGGQGQA